VLRRECKETAGDGSILAALQNCALMAPNHVAQGDAAVLVPKGPSLRRTYIVMSC
jgi:hypothetical protein